MTDNKNLDGVQNTDNTVTSSEEVKDSVVDSTKKELPVASTVSGNISSDSVKAVDSVSDNHNLSVDNNVFSEDKPKHKGMENLVSLADRTTEEKRQIGIKGGKASGEARRKKKHMREIAQNLLAHNMREEQIEEVLGTAKDLLDGDLSVAAVLTARMIQEAADGNYKAFEVLRDTAGYKPKDQVEVENISEADKALLERIAQRVGLHNPVNSNQITG